MWCWYSIMKQGVSWEYARKERERERAGRKFRDKVRKVMLKHFSFGPKLVVVLNYVISMEKIYHFSYVYIYT